MRFATLAIGLAAFLFPAISYAADGCSAVLEDKAFNTTNSKSVAQIYDRARNQMCQTHWTDAASFAAEANSLGIDIGYAGFTFGLDSSNQSDSSSYSKAYDHYCSMSDAAYTSYMMQQGSAIDASYAVKAWDDCVTREEGVFAKITENPDYSYFDVEFYNNTNNSEYSLESIQTSDDSMICKVGDVTIDPTPAKPFTIDGRRFDIGCKKDQSKPITISFNSSIGTPLVATIEGFNLSPQDIIALQKKVGELENREANDATQLQSTVTQLSAVNSTLSADIQARTSELGMTLARYNNQCPAGWQLVGQVGIIINDGYIGNVGQKGQSSNGWSDIWRGGRFNDSWNWIHPWLCVRG